MRTLRAGQTRIPRGLWTLFFIAALIVVVVLTTVRFQGTLNPHVPVTLSA